MVMMKGRSVGLKCSVSIARLNQSIEKMTDFLFLIHIIEEQKKNPFPIQHFRISPDGK